MQIFIELRVEMKDDGKLIDLSKQQELEIDFQGSEGKIANKEKKGVILNFFGGYHWLPDKKDNKK